MLARVTDCRARRASRGRQEWARPSRPAALAARATDDRSALTPARLSSPRSAGGGPRGWSRSQSGGEVPERSEAEGASAFGQGAGGAGTVVVGRGSPRRCGAPGDPGRRVQTRPTACRSPLHIPRAPSDPLARATSPTGEESTAAELRTPAGSWTHASKAQRSERPRSWGLTAPPHRRRYAREIKREPPRPSDTVSPWTAKARWAPRCGGPRSPQRQLPNENVRPRGNPS